MKQLSLARMGALALAISAMSGAYAADTKSVAVTAIVEHPALDAVRDGVKDALKAAGYEDGKSLKWQYQSAQGNTGTAAQIARKLDGRSTRFDMVLTPEDLGRVDVSLEIDSDGRLTARLAFDNPAAATDLRGRADELRRQLQDAGFHLSQDSLEFSERNPSSGFGGGAFDRPPDRRAFTGAARLAADADLAVPPAGAWTSLSLTPDRVDLKV